MSESSCRIADPESRDTGHGTRDTGHGNNRMIRRTQQSDARAILAMVENSGQFDADGLAHVQRTLDQHLAGQGDEIWLTADDGEPVAVAYCAPEPVTCGTWNLLMLWTREDRQGQGHGSGLVKRLENELRDRHARLLIVETSGLPEFATARTFYAKLGFTQEATIRDFFDSGDDKLVLTKPLEARSA